MPGWLSLTLHFGPGHDLMVCEISPALGSVLTVRSLLGFLYLPLFLSLVSRAGACARSLSLSQK